MKEHLAEIAIESTNVSQNLEAVASLVSTLSETFGSATELYRKVRRKIWENEQDDGKSYRKDSQRRRDSSDSDEESIAESSAVIRAKYNYGYDHLGERFAVGDLLAQNKLQAQIIVLQQTIIRLHQREETDLSPFDLRRLVRMTQSAREAAKDALTALYQRLRRDDEHPEFPGAFRQSLLEPHEQDIIVHPRRGRRGRSISRSRSRSNPNPWTNRPPHPNLHHQAILTLNTAPSTTQLFCPYALDLQHSPTQPLADSFHQGSDGWCPYCRYPLSLWTKRAWEIVFEDENPFSGSQERKFIVGSRFAIKCHREGGGFACVLCWRWRDSDTVCREVEELVDHVWREHGVGEVLGDGDVWEVG